MTLTQEQRDQARDLSVAIAEMMAAGPFRMAEESRLETEQILLTAIEHEDFDAVKALVDETIRIAGGPGSGNHGHAGREGKIGGSAPAHGVGFGIAPNSKEFDPEDLQGDPANKPNDVQAAKLKSAFETIDKLLHDPDIGQELWATLSSFTPVQLKDRLHEMSQGHHRPIYGGKGEQLPVRIKRSPSPEKLHAASDVVEVSE